MTEYYVEQYGGKMFGKNLFKELTFFAQRHTRFIADTTDTWMTFWRDIYSLERFSQICDESVDNYLMSDMIDVHRAIEKYWAGERDDALIDLEALIDLLVNNAHYMSVSRHIAVSNFIVGLIDLREQIAERSF